MRSVIRSYSEIVLSYSFKGTPKYAPRRFFLELEARGAMPESSVLVTTDHGFTGRFHVARTGSNVDTWIATLNLTLRTDRYAKLLDVTPTILDYFGISTSSINPVLEGSSLLPPAP